MTRLLVSVRSVDEAREALDAGVDLIDFKEPRRGSLGSVDASLAAEMVQAIAGRAPVSMACGELVQSSSTGRGREMAEKDSSPSGRGRVSASPPLCLYPPAGVSYAKLGLAGCAAQADWPRRWADWIAGLPPGTTPVAVAYADWNEAAAPPPEEVLRHAAALGCRAVLVDTFDKSKGDLLHHFNGVDLRRFAADVRQRGMLSVFAGSLSWRCLPEVLGASPDYVAVRGAVCSGSREAAIDASLVRQWVERVRRGAEC